MYDLNPNKKIKLYYFDTLIQKQFNKNTDYLCSENINSGLSGSDYIIIWRREELYKVLIHELIHYLNLDIKQNDKLDTIIKYNIGKFNYPILINESITEIQAQFIHTIYILISDNTKLEDVINLFKKFYLLEHIFSWYQFSKIMKFFSIDSFDEQLIKENFNQTSNAYSYYILKTIFAIHFFDILSNLKYIKKLINNNEKCQIINTIKYCVNNKPLNLINKIIKLDCNFNYNSLKMSLFSCY